MKIVKKPKKKDLTPRGLICVNMSNGQHSHYPITEDVDYIYRIRDSAISMWRDLMMMEVEVTRNERWIGAYITSPKTGNKVLCYLMVLFSAAEWALLVKSNDSIVKIVTAQRMKEKDGNRTPDPTN